MPHQVAPFSPVQGADGRPATTGSVRRRRAGPGSSSSSHASHAASSQLLRSASAASGGLAHTLHPGHWSSLQQKLSKTRMAASKNGTIGEELDDDDDARLLDDVKQSSYAQWRRQPMPISYLQGTSMIRHNTHSHRDQEWCHPGRAKQELPTAPWRRPVSPSQLRPMPGNTPTASAQSRERKARLLQLHKQRMKQMEELRQTVKQQVAARHGLGGGHHGHGHGSGAAAGTGKPGSAASTGSGAGAGAGGWSSRASTPGSSSSGISGYKTIRNGTSWNMPSFKRLPKGHPQSVLYTAHYPNLAISHITRPGTAGVSAKFHESKRRNPGATEAALVAQHRRSKMNPLLLHAPAETTTTLERTMTAEEWTCGQDHNADDEGEFRRPKGLFTTYMRQAVLKNVQYYKVGH